MTLALRGHLAASEGTYFFLFCFAVLGIELNTELYPQLFFILNQGLGKMSRLDLDL